MAKSSNGLNTTTNISSGSSNKIKNGGNGTIVGNLIRKITGAPAPSKPMVFTVGAGMTAPQTAAAYNKISGTSVNKITAPSKKPVLTANAPLPGVPGGLMQPRVNNTALQGLNLSMPGSKQSTTPNSGNVSLGPIQPEWQGPIQQTNGGGGSWGGSIARNTVSNTGSRSGTSYSGTSTGGGSAGTGTGSLATPTGAAVIGSSEFDYSKTPQQIAEEEALRRSQDYNDQQSQQDLNYENIMRDTLRQFQGEIDATNQVYADKLRIAGIQGQSRLGQTRAENFNSGAVNSSFGNAAQDRTQSYNNDIEAGIQAQKLQSLAQIENSARELGNKYYEQKKAAKESGLAGYLENIKSAGTQKEAIAQDIATSMINSGLTVDEISPAKLELIAKNAGVPLQQIKNTFKAMQKAFEKESLTSTSKSASVQEYEYAKQNGYTGSFTDYQNEDANRKAVSSGSGSGGLTPYQQFQATQSIAKDTQKRTENAREMSRQANMISSGYNAIVNSKDKKNRSLQTQAIITSFNKILDPTSVVRESEYDRTSAGQSLLQRLEGKVNNIAQGGAGVTDATLKEASDIAKEYLKNSQASVLAENQRAVAMANQFGLNSDFVTTSYSGGGNSGSGGGGLYDF